MTAYEPSNMEVWLTIAIGSLANGFYKEYVDRLDLKGNERVLELGPSAGNISRHLAERLLKGGCLTAVDISSVWVEKASQRLRRFPNVEVKMGDIAQLDIPDGSQDAVVLSFVLHDIPRGQRQTVMDYTIAKLRPGGTTFVREPLRGITPGEIRQILAATGLEEQRGAVAAIRTQGPVYEGVFIKRI